MKQQHSSGIDRSTARSSRRGFLKASALAMGVATFGAPLILRGADAASTAANSRLRLVVVGCGGQGRSDMKNLITAGAEIVAFCDPDPSMIDNARKEAGKMAGEGPKAAKAYADYRQLLENAGAYDAVLIATPDHWHAPLCKAFMKAGKHIYCEKPLTHSVAEARELRQLADAGKFVTQMGNQGSASPSMRRCCEIIKAGALGQIREVYQWGIGVTAKEGSADGEDPIPAGFNWDLWVGPSAMRPYKKGVYHPYKWRGWFDFGNGGMADFSCHAINLPMRALELGYPEKIVVNIDKGKQLPGKAALELHFPARGNLPPVVFYWQGGGKPPAHILQPLVDIKKEKTDGLMIIGEKGCIHTSHWATNGLVRLEGDKRLGDVLRHAPTKSIPESLPRTKSHQQEFVDACRGECKTYSPFQVGGKLTEIGLSAIVALRTGRSIDWDGENMAATNAPEAAKFVRTEWRTKWLAV